MTKRYILFLLTACVYICSVYSQNKFEPEWNIGVGFGPTLSSVDIKDWRNSGVDTKTWNQYHGGIAIRYMSERHLGIIAELNYAQVGWQQDFKDLERPDFSHSRQLTYLDLPVLTHIYFGNKVRFIFNLGPKISYMIGQKEKMSKALEDYLASGEMSPNMITHQYYRKAETKFDYGIIAGTGIEIRTGVGNFALEGRYYFGLGDIYKNSKADYFARSANRVISAKLTYYTKLF